MTEAMKLQHKLMRSNIHTHLNEVQPADYVSITLAGRHYTSA
jgi:hypothetical protein